MPSKDFSLNIIKARVAETIIQELFQSNGYTVFSYGMERTVPGIMQTIKGMGDEVARAIRSQPDFVVQRIETGELYYLEVKFRASGAFGIESLPKNFPYKNAHFVLVSPRAIKIISYAELAAGENILPCDSRFLGSSQPFEFTPECMERYTEYARKFFISYAKDDVENAPVAVSEKIGM